MKIGLFTDSHYCGADVLCGTRRPKLSFKKIKEAMNAFAEAECRAVFCLGDIIDHSAEDTKDDIRRHFSEALELIKSFGLPFYLVPGNHDYLVMKAEELFSEIGTPVPPYKINLDNKTFIILDANFRDWGERFDTGGVLWTDSNLPKAQLEFLESTLSAADDECVVLVHECLDNTTEVRHIIKNAAEVRRVIKDSGKVKTVISGHFHKGADTPIDGIRYLTLPAMCEGEENSFCIMEI